MADEEQPLVLPIIDSHIHLWPESEQADLAWNSLENPLWGQHSIEQYKSAAKSAPSLLGFIHIEADRKQTEDGEAGWENALAEVRWLKRVALGEPRDGEGHTAEDKKLCLAIVPWAPMAEGPAALEKYIDRVQEEAGEAWGKVKGFRYLLQDKPHGTMLTDEFIGSLRLLGKKGFSFDVGIDQHRRGKKQLEEAVEMIERAHSGVPEDEQVTFILGMSSLYPPAMKSTSQLRMGDIVEHVLTDPGPDHLCKPDMSIYNTTSDRNFHAWRTAMYTLSKGTNTYMKLSGGFSEMPDRLRSSDSASHIFQSTLAWLGIVLATFGPERIMFGSDWPICTGGGLGESAWPRWRDVVEKTCWMATLSDEERAMIFGGTAKKAYRL